MVDKVDVCSLKEILSRLDVDVDLSSDLLNVRFLDCYTEVSKNKNGDVVLFGLLGDDEQTLVITDGTVEQHEIIGGVERVRTFDKHGFDSSSVVLI